MQKKLSVIAVLVLASLTLLAQKPFEGKITYRVDYIDLPEGEEGVRAILPDVLIAYVSGENLRLQQYVTLGGEMTEVQPAGRDSIYRCLYMMDKRVMLAHPKYRGPMRYRVKRLEQTREWNGWELQKYALSSANVPGQSAWVIEGYSNPFTASLPELKFLPMEMELQRAELLMHLTAIKIEELPLDPTYFDLPSEIERIDDRVLQQLLN